MRTVSVTEFKAHCLEFLNQVATSGQSLMLTKRGKPTAIVGPAPASGQPCWVLGQFEGGMKLVGDMVAPFDEEWKTQSVTLLDTASGLGGIQLLSPSRPIGYLKPS